MHVTVVIVDSLSYLAVLCNEWTGISVYVMSGLVLKCG